MKRPADQKIICHIYQLLVVVLFSTSLMASPYIFDGYDHQHNGIAHHHSHDQDEYQFNRLSDAVPIDLNKNHLKVLPVLLIPSDLTPTVADKDAVAGQIKTLMLEVQTFYQDQMAADGYLDDDGIGKTFELVEDPSGQVTVYQKVGAHSLSEYDSWAANWSGNLINNIYPDLGSDNTLQADYPEDRTIYYVVMLDVAYTGGIAKANSPSSGICVVSTENLNSALTTHELGHAFGLGHDWRPATFGADGRQKYYILGYRWFGKSGSDIILSSLAKAIVGSSPFFNRGDFDSFDITAFSAPQIEVSSNSSYPSGSMTHQVDFTITDNDGLHMVAFYGRADVGSSFSNYRYNGDTVPISSIPGESFSLIDGRTSFTGSYNFGTHESATTDLETFYSPGSSSQQAEVRQVYLLAIDRTGKQTWHNILLYHENRIPTRHIIEAGESLNEVLYSRAWPKDEIIFNADSVETEPIYIYKNNLKISSADPKNPRRIPVEVRIEGAKSIRLSSLSMLNVYMAPDSTDITVENCEITNPNSYPYVGVDIGQGAEVTLVNTLIYDHNVGVQLAGADLSVINCTIVDNTYEFLSPGTNTINIVNTIFAENSSGWDVPSSQLINISNSLFDRTLPTNVSAENGNISGDPKFQDAANRDYQLQDSSPAIDAGSTNITSLPNTDKIDNQRIFGDTVDIGAYENGSLRQTVTVNIPDTNLRSLLEQALGKGSGDSITDLELDGLSGQLDASSSSISNLAGLEYCINLTFLNLHDNQISDLSALSNLLTSLTELDLSQNRISNIRPISNLTKVTDLNLLGNQITDISLLSNLANLIELNLGGNQITDISVLSNLSNLAELNLLGNQLPAEAGLIIQELKDRSVNVTHGFIQEPIDVNIPDANLRELLEWELGKNAGDPINHLEMASIVSSFWGLNRLSNFISDLTGLEYCVNLTHLDLRHNQYISDLSPLSNLTKLTHLDLEDNQVRDLSPLANLTSLTHLYLPGRAGKNQISDIGPLSNLTNLKVLVLSGHPFGGNISLLSNLVNLTYLDLEVNQVRDLSPLDNLTSLTHLNLHNNQISDISPLSNLVNLTYLSLGENQITNLRTLSNLTNLESLHLSGNPIINISSLSGLTNLTELYLSSNRHRDEIRDITPLYSLTSLEALGLSHTKIKDTSFLYNMTRLTRLVLVDNQLEDINFVSNLTNLTDLTLNSLMSEEPYANQITDITPLTHLDNLTELYLYNNQISDIGPLSNLTNLNRLYLYSNQINDISPLSNLSNLTVLDLQQNPLTTRSASIIQELRGTGATVLHDDPLPEVVIASIPDTNLRKLLEQELGKDVDDPISVSELSALSDRLDLSDANIGDVRGLEHCNNLNELKLNANQITDITPLTHLDNLTELYLYNNQISDIGPLSNLTNLTELYLSSNRISDIISLSNLSNLTYLDLENNPLTDSAESIIRILQNNQTTVQYNPIPTALVVKIPDVNLRYQIEQVLSKDSGVSITRIELGQISSLDASNSSITDLRGLEHCTNLTNLNLSSNQITDLGPLYSLTNLGDLNLHNNQISHLGILSNLPYLYSLNLSDNRLDNIASLSRLSYLEVLDVQNNHLSASAGSVIQKLRDGATTVIHDPIPAAIIVNIPDSNLRTALEGELGKNPGEPITDLELSELHRPTEAQNTGGWLYLVSRNITDLRGLEYCTNVTKLNLSSNQITDLSPLYSLTNLGDLRLTNNQISDIEPLSSLVNLTNLDLGANQIDDISPLSNLISLTELALSINQITDVSSLSSLTSLTDLDLRHNLVKDLTPLSNLSELRFLNLGGNRVDYIGSLSKNNYPHLIYLDLKENPLTASAGSIIQGLKDDGINVEHESIPEAQFVNFPDANLKAILEQALGKDSGATITDLELNEISRIDASGSNITDLTGLELCHNLINLDLSHNQISDITPLAGLISLTDLDLDNNQIGNISPLTDLINLINLNLVGNQLTANADSIIHTFKEAGTTVIHDEIPEIIPDANLRHKIEQALGKYSGDPISHLDLAELSQSLDASGAGITDLSGLQHCTNLTSLNLKNNQIDDITLLTNLSNLTQLELSGNNISDLSSLSRLTTLNQLELEDNSLTSIGDLKDLVQLQVLRLGKNQITEISSLSGLNQLIELSLSENQIVDISSLSRLTDLAKLHLYENEIIDLRPISDLTDLTRLSLSDNKITNLSPLEKLTQLTHIYLDGNEVSDLSILSNLDNATELWLGQNQIRDISPLSNLAGLTNLSLPDNQISYLGTVDSLNQLAIIDLRDNQISHINELSDLSQLSELKLEGNPLKAGARSIIQDLKTDGAIVTHDEIPTNIIEDSNLRAVLQEALNISQNDPVTAADLDDPSLTTLAASGRSISDLTGLEYGIYLTNLDLSGNDIDNITPLLSHSGLGSGHVVDLTGNPLTYEIYSKQIPALTEKGVTVYFNPPGDTIFIPDANLQRILATAFGLEDTNQFIPLSHFSTLTELDAPLSSITNLNGLEHCVNLKQLSLEYNNINNIDILSSLNQLSYLALSFNQIDDISSLEELINLDEVYLDNNRIKNIQSLVDNDGIDSDSDYLLLTHNPLSNVSMTHLIPQLESRNVTVSADYIDNVIAFSDPNLEGLIRAKLDQPIELLTTTNTSSLKDLDAQNSGITNLDGLNDLKNLNELNISFNPLSEHAAFHQIDELQISGVEVTHAVGHWLVDRQQDSDPIEVLSKPDEIDSESDLASTPYLDGTHDWVAIPNRILINLGGPSVNKTITTIFKVDNSSIEQHKQVIYEQGGDKRGLNLYVHKGRLYGGGYNREVSENNWQGEWISTSISSDKWYKASLVLRRNTQVIEDINLELWLNGNLISIQPAAKIYGDTGEIGIGNVNQSTLFHDGTSRQQPNHFFAGSIASISIYNTALPENSLQAMTIGSLASLETIWSDDPEQPSTIEYSSDEIIKPLGKLNFKPVNGSSTIKSIRWYLDNKITPDGHGDELGAPKTLANPAAIKLYGYIGDKNEDRLISTAETSGQGNSFVFKFSPTSSENQNEDVLFSVNSGETFYIDLAIDPSKLTTLENRQQIVQLSLSLSNIETTAVGGLSQSYDDYGQPKGHRWRDELQPALDSPLEIRVELVKKQPLSVSPKFVELRYQAGGIIQMYEPSVESWVTPRLTFTNETSLETTYSLQETARISQPSLVSLTPVDNDSNNPLSAGSADISDIKTLFTDDDLTVEISYSGTLTHHQNQKVIGQILIDTGRTDNTMSALPASHFGFGANQTMEVDLQVELIQVNGKVVAELNDTQDSDPIGRILVKQVFSQTGQTNQLLVRIPRSLLDKPDNQPIGLAVQLEADWTPNQDSQAATITFTEVGPWTPTDLSWFQLEANNVALGIDEATKTKSLNVTMPNPPSAGIHYASLKIDDGNGFSFNLPISLSVSDNQLANLDIRPRTVGEDILVRVGDTYQFSVIGKDINGLNVDISGQTVINWVVGDSTKGGVSSTGLFNAIAVGSVRVKASIGNVVGQSSRIEILPKILGDSTGTTPSIDYPDGQPDGKVDIFDLVNMANHWHQTEDDTTASVKEFKDLDIAGKDGFDQGDEKVDIFDLVVLVDNYGTGITPAPAPAAPAILASLPTFEGGSSDLQVVSTDNTSQSGSRVRTIIDQQIELDILLNQVPNLYAYSYDLVYDQQKLDLITQEDGRPVFQDGSMFRTETGSSHSIVSQKTIENGSQMASANVTTTRLGSQSINQQSGTLGRLQFVAKSIGQTQLQVKNLILVTDSGQTFTLINQTYDLTVHQPVEHSQLDQNYPNPFNPETWIPFQLKSASPVVISIYDSTGKMIRELDLGYRVAGPHINRQEAAYWDGRNRWAEPVSSGIYFYHLKTNDNVSIKKMTVLK